MHNLMQVVDMRKQCCAANCEQSCAANCEQCCAANCEQCCAAPSEQCCAASHVQCWIMLSTRLFSHDNNVVTSLFHHQYCYNLLTRLNNNDNNSEQACSVNIIFSVSWTTVVASSMLNNIVETIVNNIVQSHWRSYTQAYTGLCSGGIFQTDLAWGIVYI